MTVFINPGSGPVAGATETNASFNAGAFTCELIKMGIAITDAARRPDLDEDGRFGWELITADGRTLEIDMPGLPLSRVRWMDEPGQNIWDFPRLYVDGASWVWKYALGACKPEDGDQP